MACRIQHEGQYLLHCTSPETVQEMKGLYVYFNSDSREERDLVRCTNIYEFDCQNEDGFTCKQRNPGHAEITIPEIFPAEPGYFRCVMPEVPPSNTTKCRWPPLVGNETSYISQVETGGISSAETAGVVIGVVIAILLLIIIALIVRHKWMKSSGRSQKCTLKEVICNPKVLKKKMCSRDESKPNESQASTKDQCVSESPLLSADSAKRTSDATLNTEVGKRLEHDGLTT